MWGGGGGVVLRERVISQSNEKALLVNRVVCSVERERIKSVIENILYHILQKKTCCC